MPFKQIKVTYKTSVITWHHPFNSSTIQYHVSDVRMYDGPGELSPPVDPRWYEKIKLCTYYLSSYQGLLTYRIPIPSNFKAGHKMPQDHFKRQGIRWESKEVLHNSADCIQEEFTGSTSSMRFQSKSGICWSLPFHTLIKFII